MPGPVRTCITSGPRDGIGDEVGQAVGDPPAGVAVVHGWHQGIIENIDVEMHPEPFEVRLGGRGQRLFKNTTGACLPDLGEVNDGDGGAPDVLAG